ncbi:MAG: DUF6273 domain-containing protein [Lachnospiraceae bacterium]|nr:DUF6273 domain-containing protein [Lachnospiraceae bacterium]
MKKVLYAVIICALLTVGCGQKGDELINTDSDTDKSTSDVYSSQEILDNITEEMTENDEAIEPRPYGNSLSKGYALDVLKDVECGSFVNFGRYEQDGNLENGTEDIEWVVLDKSDGKALLLTRYVIDGQVFNKGGEYRTWKDATLRNWLQDDFFYSAFSADEQKAIIETDNTNPGTMDFFEEDNKANLEDGLDYTEGEEGFENTKDTVFLLSLEEVQKYFYIPKESEIGPDELLSNVINEDAIAYPTDYAKSRGIWEQEELDGYPSTVTGATIWYLRSPASEKFSMTLAVYAMGIVDGDETSRISGIRPAIWVSYQ